MDGKRRREKKKKERKRKEHDFKEVYVKDRGPLKDLVKALRLEAPTTTLRMSFSTI